MSTRHTALQNAARWFDEGHFQAELARRVAHATASDAGGGIEPLAGYLSEAIQPGLQALGFECELLPNPTGGAGPLLVARRIEDPALPTVLTYGHGDVVNGQDSQWRAGLTPWTLTVEGDRWYGRGTADNKGQHTINLGALAHVIAARGGRLGYNVTVLLETGEEVGSPGLRELCEQERERLRADLLIACDGPRVHARKPTVFLGSRGIVNFRLRLRARERAYHSGNWGGVLTNPGVVISHAVATLVDARGRLLVEGLRPPPVEAAVRAALREVAIGGDADDPATNPAWGEPGLSEAERLMAWNTLEVLALGAGAPDRPINAIPHTAVAHCQLRFVPGTRWTELAQIVRAHLDERGFTDVEVEVIAATPATRLPLDNPWVAWSLASIERSVAQPATLLPNLAGSLPNDVFAGVLGLPTLWVPHSYPACSQHAPNEHLLGSVAREGLQLMAGLYWDLGERDSAPWFQAATRTAVSA
ncbi:M20 family metallopeptidase [Hydrogenophaga sp. OTU3427]|uniref:M20 family metallopeptidase n=1 Tax=Hydrogenophaga sp. OTU3427 TaxID=3043856 RepID=UPI00313D9F04